MTKIKEFDNLELMQTVRNMHLNPIIRKVENEISPDVDKLKDEMQHTFLDVNLDIPTKTLKFDRPPGSGFKNIELAPIMPTFPGIGVEDDKGTGPGSGISLLKLKDATVTQTGTTANVSYDWPKIVSDNVKDLGVGTIADGTRPTKFLFFKGADVVYTAGGAATVAIPTPASQIMASIPGKGQTTPEAITEIELEGESASSVLSNGKLTIHLNTGGGVSPASSDNFKGFFETLGDLESEISDPINGKSYAFVKDKQLGGKYYTPHFYVSGSWAELKQDPALTYSGPSDPMTHGVFSIKPSERILVDDNGQLNLDGLSTPQDPQYFHGFFNTLAELQADVPTPVANKSMAYVRHANGAWIGYQWKLFGSSFEWRVMAPIGALSLVDDKTSTTVPAPFYGIYRNDQWELDANGLATLKKVNTKTKSEIIDSDGGYTEGEFDTIQFRSGKSYVNLNKNKLFIDHPQQIIRYDEEFEADHNSRDYEGNIFYDETSRSWMGWGIPGAPGGVDKKWTRIAHPHMSDEVKGLSSRLPPKAPTTLGGTFGDNAKWENSGWTYIEPDAEGTDLPSEIRTSGAYVQTYVKEDSLGPGTIPQARIQTCYEDADGGSQWVRRFNANPANPGDPSWKPWVRTSFSNKDVDKHSDDPNAHKHVIKSYKAASFTAKYSTFYNQIEGGSPGGLRADNCSMFADNYGHFEEDHDYIEPPYDGRFRVRGVLYMSGYKEGNKTVPIGAWKVLVRIKKKDTAEWRPVGHYIYAHSDEKSRYPLLCFETGSTEVVRGDQIIINITFDNNNGINREHPDLYFVPIRSYFVLEDEHTRVGSRIARTFSKYVGTVDVTGDVGVRVHHSDPSNPKSAIRVYGDVVSHTLTEMRST